MSNQNNNAFQMIADDGIELFRILKCLNISLQDQNTVGKWRCRDVLLSLKDRLFIDVYGYGPSLWVALGHHQGDEPGTCADVQYTT